MHLVEMKPCRSVEFLTAMFTRARTKRAWHAAAAAASRLPHSSQFDVLDAAALARARVFHLSQQGGSISTQFPKTSFTDKVMQSRRRPV